ncbi:MAG: hypothetical protein VB039_05250 [Oscillospiraceae bacterium]|nr:hypothetical protein [Oscillospiraceae bacterium]
MEYTYETQYNPERGRYEVLRTGRAARVVYVSPAEASCAEYIERVKAMDAYAARKRGAI